MGQLERALKVVRFLNYRGVASFGELLEALAPVSRGTLAALLKEMVALGELTHQGRSYGLAEGVLSPPGIRFRSLPETLRAQTQVILKNTAQETGHACALFSRVGRMTMSIADQHNLGGAHWNFSHIGSEWPLVPFHGFAKVFLAYAEEAIVKNCYARWSHNLKPELVPATWEAFCGQLSSVRRKGYALEYQEESKAILRLAVPVRLPGREDVPYVLGLVARSVYLLEMDKCLPPLLVAADALTRTLSAPQGKISGA